MFRDGEQIATCHWQYNQKITYHGAGMVMVRRSQHAIARSTRLVGLRISGLKEGKIRTYLKIFKRFERKFKGKRSLVKIILHLLT